MSWLKRNSLVKFSDLGFFGDKSLFQDGLFSMKDKIKGVISYDSEEADAIKK
jgi:hypothetical protein